MIVLLRIISGDESSISQIQCFALLLLKSCRKRPLWYAAAQCDEMVSQVVRLVCTNEFVCLQHQNKITAATAIKTMVIFFK